MGPVKIIPITDPKEARAKYGLSRSRPNAIRTLPDYDTLKAEFESDCTSFAEIGSRYGPTRARIQQIYKRFFSAQIPRRPDGRTREKVCTLKRRALKKTTKQEQLFSNHPMLLALKLTTESLDLKVQSISADRGGQIISINGKRCAVYSCREAHKTNSKGKPYWTFNLNHSVLKRSEVVVCVALDNKEFRFFVIPVCDLPARFFETRVMLCVPQEGRDPKGRGRRMGCSFDVVRYENAWHLLKSSEDKKTAPAVPVLPVSSSPVS